MVAATAECALKFQLSPGNAGDASQGRQLLLSLGSTAEPCNLLMDRAYEGNETRQLSRDLGFSPVVPPNPNRLEPWEYDKELYKKRNEVERLFRRLKRFRRVFARYDKLDVMFMGFIVFALIVESPRRIA
jgi:transposase